MRPRSRSSSRPIRSTEAAHRIGLACLAFGACTQATPEADRYLVTPAVSPQVLTEAEGFEPPPSRNGNRFVQGWWPWRERRKLHLVAHREVARLQVVNLAPRERELKLGGARWLDGAPAHDVEVLAAGRVVGRIRPGETSTTLEPIESVGRVTLDLRLAPGKRLALDRATIGGALSAGDVEVEGRDIEQSGYSAVEIADATGGAATLVGSFEAPSQPRPGQRFSLWVQPAEGSLERVWTWSEGSGTPGRIEIPVPRETLIRVLLVAEGEGGAGRWRGLGFVEPPAPVPAPAAAPAAPRLVVLYVMDALRADRLGHLGGDGGLTPTLDRLAAEGVTFEAHHSTAPNTLPATKTLFTGQVFVDRGMDDLPAPGTGPATLSEAFAGAGYWAGMFTGNGYVFYQARRGFTYIEPSVLFESYPSPGYNDNSERVHEAVLKWLDKRPRRPPTFLYVHTVNPHNPYSPPAELEARFTEDIASEFSADTESLLAVMRGRLPVDEADRVRIEALYDAGVAYADREIDGFLAGLLERYPRGEVLIVFTSDHGEELFDHDGVLHGWTLRENQLDVPLVFWWPGVISEPRVVTGPTDHLDLHATLRRMIDPEGPALPAGRDLWPAILRGEDPPPAELHYAVAAGVPGGIFSVRTDRWKLIWAPRRGAGWGLGEGIGRSRDAHYLFDLETDPDELVNLAGNGSVEAAYLRNRLEPWIAAQRALERGEAPAELTDEARRNLEALGYLD